MGLGIGIDCERCGNQLSYARTPFMTKNDGVVGGQWMPIKIVRKDGHDLCGDCLKDLGKNTWDEENLE